VYYCLAYTNRELQALVELRVNHNRLQILPSFNQLCTNSGSFLPRLATVHVSNNQLSQIPDEIGYLPSLQVWLWSITLCPRYWALRFSKNGRWGIEVYFHVALADILNMVE